MPRQPFCPTPSWLSGERTRAAIALLLSSGTETSSAVFLLTYAACICPTLPSRSSCRCCIVFGFLEKQVQHSNQNEPCLHSCTSEGATNPKLSLPNIQLRTLLINNLDGLVVLTFSHFVSSSHVGQCNIRLYHLSTTTCDYLEYQLAKQDIETRSMDSESSISPNSRLTDFAREEK